jgi:hypothetical protein
MDSSALESAAKALEIAIRSNEARSDALSFSLNFFIALVVLGVVIEVFVVIKEYHHDKAEFLRGIIHSPSRPSRLDLFLNLLGAILVAIGVAGEFGVGLEVGTVESELRNNNRKLVGLLNVEAGNARVEAGKAIDSAGRLTKEAATLRKQAADEQLARAKLEAEVQPRTLTPKQQQYMADICRPFLGHSIRVRSYSGDAESSRLAEQIVVALAKAQSRVDNQIGSMIVLRAAPFAGIAISSVDPALAKAIFHSLAAAGILSTIVPRRPDEKEMTMSVGVKPYELLK